MTVTELRFGNLVEYKITDSQDERQEWWELNPIDVFDLQHLFEFPEDGFFRPIPLTEEWLLKFGFEKQNEWWFKDHKLSIEKWSTKEGIDVRLRTSEDSSVFITDIQYVHQLQNLYFALCGEELTIKNRK